MTLEKIIAVAKGYGLELLKAAACAGLLAFAFGPGAVAGYMVKTADEWNDVTGLLFSVSIAIWLAYINIKSSSFGDYLVRRGDARVYDYAFTFPMPVLAATTVALISCRAATSSVIPLSAFALLVYSGFNTWNLVRNAAGFVALNSRYRALLDGRERPERPPADERAGPPAQPEAIASP